MKKDSAKRQLQKAKDMLGISDERAEEIFEEEPDRKQQKKKQLESTERQELEAEDEVNREPSREETPGAEAEPEDLEREEEVHECPECGKEFDSSRGMKVHKGQVH